MFPPTVQERSLFSTPSPAFIVWSRLVSGRQTPDAGLRGFLPRLMRAENLSRQEARALLEALLNGDATDAQIAAALIALKLKGETVEELAGLADVMRARAVGIRSRHRLFIDTAGTGSSCAKSFNVSGSSRRWRNHDPSAGGN